MTDFFEQHNDPLSQRITTGLSKLSLALRHQAWRAASPRGLTPTQGQILTFLDSRPGAGLGEVADSLGVKPATASEAVRTLVEKGWVTKSKHPRDARARWLQVTQEGREVASEARLWPDFMVSAVDSLSAEEQTVLLRAILRMIRHLQLHDQIPSVRMCLACQYFRPRAHANADKPHHCALVDAPLGEIDVRLDCPDHLAVPAEDGEILFSRYFGD